MATAKITLIGAYKWMNNQGMDLFAQLNLPDGVDRQTLTDTILMNGAEFEILYADPEFMVDMIGIWCKKWYHTMERWAKALSYDYEPLENYDRKEDWTDDGTSSSIGTTNGLSESKQYASAYNQTGEGFTPDASDTSNSSTGTTANATSNQKHNGRVHGNIGVTTSQQMLQSEIDLYKNFNLYNEISNLFLSELCIYTY